VEYYYSTTLILRGSQGFIKKNRRERRVRRGRE